VVTVAVATERDGARTVVSHAAKHIRGLIVRHLLERAGPAPRTAEALTAAAAERFTVELGPRQPGRPRAMTVVLRA